MSRLLVAAMQKLVLLATGVTVVCLSLLSASDAKGASEVHSFAFGRAVQAFWEFSDTDGSFTSVFASADAQAAPGSRNTRNVFMEVSRFSPGADPADPSDDVFRTITGFEELAPGGLVLSGKELDWATLQVSIPAEDCTFSGRPGPEPPPPGGCTATTISADLVWTATGPMGSQHGAFHDRFAGCMTNAHFRFTGRPAGVEGPVTVGSTDYTRGETGSGILIARSRDQQTLIGNCFGPELVSASDARGASEVHKGSLRPAVQASWEFPQADGGFSGIFVFAGEERIQTPQGPQTGRNVFIEVFQVSPGADPADPSDDVFRIISGGRALAPGELVLSGKQLDSATLQIEIAGQDCTVTGPPGPEPPSPGSCTPATIEADLTWAATGPLGSRHGTFHDRFEGCISNTHFRSTSRPASVEGPVLVGTTDYTRGEPAFFAELITRANDQSVSIGDACFPF